MGSKNKSARPKDEGQNAPAPSAKDTGAPKDAYMLSAKPNADDIDGVNIGQNGMKNVPTGNLDTAFEDTYRHNDEKK